MEGMRRGEAPRQQTKSGGSKRYKHIEDLGEGTFGKVFLVKDTTTGKLLACKQSKQQQGMADAINEKNIMSTLGEHPNIVQFHSSYVEGGRHNILMEYCDIGNLSDFIDRFGKTTDFSPNQKVLNHKVVRYVTRCLLEGLNHLSKHKIMHRDIKLDNVMVKTKESAQREGAKRKITDLDFKLSDFGTAKQYKDESDLHMSHKGTPQTMSGNVLFEKPYSIKIDVWSFGVTVYQMIFGQLPYPAKDMEELYDRHKNHTFKIPSGVSIQTSCVDFLLQGCLRTQEAKRLSWSQLLQHRWILNDRNSTERCLDDTIVVDPRVTGDHLSRQHLKRIQQTKNELKRKNKEAEKNVQIQKIEAENQELKQQHVLYMVAIAVVILLIFGVLLHDTYGGIAAEL